MKVSTTLENIEYTLQQRNKQQEQEKTKQEIKKEYIDYLEEITSDLIFQWFLGSGDYTKTYNYLFLNSDSFINDLIKEAREESKCYYTTKSKLIDIGDKWVQKEEIVYLWDDFYIEKDIHKIYFKELEQIKKEYKTKNKIIESDLIEELDNNFISIFEKQDYNAALNFFKSDSIRDLMIQEITKNTYKQEFLRNNYFKELNKIKNMYRIKKEDKKQINYTPARRTTTRNKNTLGATTPLLLTGASIIGVVNGLIKASKK